MKKHLSTILLILVMLAGFGLLLYPSFSNFWNSFRQSRVVAGYTEAVEKMDPAIYEQLRQKANTYNQTLLSNPNRFQTESESTDYHTLLNAAGNGVMGTIEIPCIGVKLPVYHTTDPAVLQKAIGHLEGSSLPIGGPGTHSVLSGHRGLPSAKLFTDLDRMNIGDLFELHVLDEKLTYQVDQITVVKPNETELLDIDPESDFCTLITCTPYGINTHRLLVRGRRIETIETAPAFAPVNDATPIQPTVVFGALCSLLLIFWGVLQLLHPQKR